MLIYFYLLGLRFILVVAFPLWSVAAIQGQKFHLTAYGDGMVGLLEATKEGKERKKINYSVFKNILAD